MSDTYVTVAGFVQFDPEAKTLPGGARILNFTVQGVGFTGQPNVQITLFDEWEDSWADVALGSAVLVNGKYKQGGSGGKVFHNVTATKLAVDGVTKVRRAREDGAAASTAAAGSDTQPAF